ncbi:CLUMA_CG008459, isoform A [Clunio marinus]|uniref:Uridine diphosphate glucose pyrophosphatase NUDT14 n=1 Tax=Clunio marinus TaxID=568069 RepID=A0A1J1I452_9DIPT|nr:CLUMA_CG008459, isoform A [Clunio marinus]
MDKVSNVRVGPLPNDSPYMKPFRLYFKQNGKEKNWDLVKAHDSVAIITLNKTRNKLVVVKQFRPAVYYGQICDYLNSVGSEVDSEKVIEMFPPKNAITMELCAGIVDKDISLVEIAREELIEECGYDVPVNRIEEVIRFRSGVGTTGSLQVMYYCEVTDDDKINGAGGGVDDELIDVHELSIEEAKEMLKQGTEHTSPPGFLFGILWFLTNKAQNL